MSAQQLYKWLGRAAAALALFLMGATQPAFAQASCVFTGSRCLDSGGERNINGYVLTRPCWQYEDTYNCVDPSTFDHCAGIAAVSSCTQTNANCTANSTINGTCISLTRTYQCGTPVSGLPTDVVILPSVYTISTETVDAAACTTLANNPGCFPTGQVCTQGPETRNINGLDVYRDCWQYENTYACVVADVVDYCSPLGNAGCVEDPAARTCAATGPDGVCNRWTRQFVCGNAPPQSGTSVILLNTSYTIVQDGQDTSACVANNANPACAPAGQVCTQGPATRNINGLDVYRDCWEWTNQYTCTVTNAVDYCAPLTNPAMGCTEMSSSCVETSATTGQCNAWQRQYRCGDQLTPLPVNVVYLNTAYNIGSAVPDESACTDYANNPDCTYSSQTCVEGPETRNINGALVYQECWRYDRQYICVGSTPVSDCTDLQNNPRCVQRSAEPGRTQGGAVDPYVIQRIFDCEVTPASETTTTECRTNNCVAGVCPPAQNPPDRDFGYAVTMAEIAREGAKYQDRDGRLFTGYRASCIANGSAGIRRCCDQDVRAGGTNSEVMSLAKDFLWQAVKYIGSEYVFDPLYSALAEALGIASMATDTAYETAAGTAASSGGGFTFGAYGLTYNVSTGVVAFDPYSFAIAVAIQIIIRMSECDQDEQALSMRRGQRLCAFVGGYSTGSSLSRRRHEVYCCYNSRLARIINEQARPQIGYNFGSPESEQCEGFTPEQIAQIDFSQLDFSEFIAEVAGAGQSATGATNRLDTRVNQMMDQYNTRGNGELPGARNVPTIGP